MSGSSVWISNANPIKDDHDSVQSILIFSIVKAYPQHEDFHKDVGS